MSPLEEAWHDWADANDGATAAECFRAGWEARGAEVDLLTARRDTDAGFWRHRVASVEAERDAVMLKLASCEYERAAFRQQRDELARAFTEAKGEHGV